MTSIDMAEVIKHADILSAMIAHSEIALEYRSSRHELDTDVQAKILIQDFNHKKDLYEDVQRFGKYHPDYQRIRKEMFESKRTLENHPTIARYKKAEKELEELLYEISLIIATPISEDIKVPGTNPFFNTKGCGSGGCGSGGCSSCG